MKRCICMLLATLLLLSGCAAPDDGGNAETEVVPAVSVEFKEADLTADKPTITVTWHNNGDETVQATSAFDILRYDRDGYLDCFDSTHYYADVQFTLKTYKVAPSTSVDVTYDVSAYILPPTRVLLFQAHYFLEDGTEPAPAEFSFMVNNDSEVVPLRTDGLQYGTTDESSTEVGGFSVTIEKQYVKDGYTVLEIVWHNTTKLHATFGEPYEILYLGNGSAESCLVNPDTVWIMPAYLLPPGGTFEKTYTPDRYGTFDLSRKGLYQFRSSCNVETPDGETMQSFVMVNFTIE